MAFDEHPAERIRDEVGDRPDPSAERLFGGIAFPLRGMPAREFVETLRPR